MGKGGFITSFNTLIYQVKTFISEINEEGEILRDFFLWKFSGMKCLQSKNKSKKSSPITTPGPRLYAEPLSCYGASLGAGFVRSLPVATHTSMEQLTRVPPVSWRWSPARGQIGQP
jgi:hypothetical protein